MASRSRWSLWSEESILSIASRGSILSVGCVGSIASVASAGSICSVLAVASAGSMASIMSFRSSSSLLSSGARDAVMGRTMGRQDRVMLAGTIAVATILLVGGGAGRDSSRRDARHRRVHGFDDGLAVLSLAVLAGVTRSLFKLRGVVL